MAIINPSGQPIKRNSHHLQQSQPSPVKIKSNQQCCFNCDFARSMAVPGSRPIEEDEKANSVGCHRYPPQMLITPGQMPGVIQVGGHFPAMECGAYCGEFKLREDGGDGS